MSQRVGQVDAMLKNPAVTMMLQNAGVPDLGMRDLENQVKR